MVVPRKSTEEKRKNRPEEGNDYQSMYWTQTAPCIPEVSKLDGWKTTVMWVLSFVSEMTVILHSGNLKSFKKLVKQTGCSILSKDLSFRVRVIMDNEHVSFVVCTLPD